MTRAFLHPLRALPPQHHPLRPPLRTKRMGSRLRVKGQTLWMTQPWTAQLRKRMMGIRRIKMKLKMKCLEAFDYNCSAFVLKIPVLFVIGNTILLPFQRQTSKKVSPCFASLTNTQKQMKVKEVDVLFFELAGD